MKYDASVSRFLARAYEVLELTGRERDKINDALPRLGDELPEWVATWIKDNRAKVRRLTPSFLR